MIKRLLLCLIICLISVSGMAQPSLTFPRLTGQVIDEANILSPDTERAILMTMMPQQQFVVVTLRSLRGRSIEEYGVALGRHWGIGSSEKNDGLLLIVAPNEREVRIEVGYGLEHIMTDAKAAQIIQDIILPVFRKNQYEQGILNGVYQMQNVLRGEEITLPSNELTRWKSLKLYCFFFFFYMVPFLEAQSVIRRIRKKEKKGLLLKQDVKDLKCAIFIRAVTAIWYILPLFIGLLIDSRLSMVLLFGGSFFLILFGWLMLPKINSGRSFSSYDRDSSSFRDSHDSFSGGGGSFGGGGSSGRW